MESEVDLGGSLAVQAAALSELVAEYVQPALRQAGVSFGTFELLSAIHYAGPNASQIEIARRLGITAPSLSEAIKASVAKGLIKQSASGTDQRSKRVQLTSSGTGALQTVLHAVEDAERAMLAGISSTDLRHVSMVLRQAMQNLRREMLPKPGSRV